MGRDFEDKSQQRYLITGASRGIGLELVRQVADLGHEVIATCRDLRGANDLRGIAEQFPDRVTLKELDVTDPESIGKLMLSLGSQPIDVLINNAGILLGHNQDMANLDFDEVISSFQVNAVGPLRMTQALLPNLQKSPEPKVISITSKMGSIDDNSGGGYYAYRMSKAALNMFNKSLSCDYENMICVVMHPGWVQTDMGGKGALITVRDSVQGILKVMTGLQLSDSGRFFDFRGNQIAW